MALIKGPLIFGRHLIGVGVLILVGATAAQLPAFVQQYLQRLGGHLDEARLMAAELARGDAYRDLTPSVREAVLSVSDQRISTLSNAYDAIAGADGLTRPLVFLAHVDSTIAAAAWGDFEPGLPLGWGGLLYGGAAAVIAYLVYAGCRGLFGRRRRIEPPLYRE
jgi:hypothetical protein